EKDIVPLKARGVLRVVVVGVVPDEDVGGFHHVLDVTGRLVLIGKYIVRIGQSVFVCHVFLLSAALTAAWHPSLPLSSQLPPPTYYLSPSYTPPTSYIEIQRPSRPSPAALQVTRSFQQIVLLQDLHELVPVHLADQGPGLVVVGDVGGVLGEDVA